MEWNELLKEIPITEIENVKIGNAEDLEHATGCTVIICEQGAPTGVDVRGGGPASRESELFNPSADCQAIHAVLLSGGSAFGLDAAGGVMEYLAEKGVGFAVGPIRVPLVAQSCIFDLSFVSAEVKPDKAMARRACENAEFNCPTEGNVGAGCGATVGKFGDLEQSMNSGLGLYAVQLGDMKVGAVVSVNACGDVYDEETNQILAGMLTPDKTAFADSEKVLYQMYQYMSAMKKAEVVANTTIGCILTNAKFTKAQLNKIAALAQNGYARSIRPVHTMMDGDTIYAMSTGEVEADLNIVGTLAARVMAQAVKRAVLNTETFHGRISASDLHF
ncbi:MAG: P1 family peptidase [Lachnospiraceae bacterium]|nr:P1 family peptidase [Lachnospiraceae bacterium]